MVRYYAMKNVIIYVFLCATMGMCHARSPYARILGGEQVSIQEYPYQISLRSPLYSKPSGSSQPGHFCGGSIITKKHILTAAHCFDHYKSIDKATSEVTIHASTSRSDTSGNVYSIESIKKHPGYFINDYDYPNDVAVITLKNAMEFSETQQPIELPTEDIQSGSLGTITGWGVDESDEFSIHLKKITEKVVDYKECQRFSPPDSGDFDNTIICGLDPRNRREIRYQIAACHGDSGGPLVVDGKVVGVVSFHIGTCDEENPDFYANVYVFLDFIKGVIQS